MTSHARISFLLAGILVGVGACHRGDDDARVTKAPDLSPLVHLSAATHATTAGRATAPARPALDHATQTDLARELDDADRRGTWSEVRARWQGQALRWTVTRHRVLCGSADACHVAAFPVQRPAQRGWLPGLRFAPGEYAKLETACGAAAQCQVTFEGTLGELAVSPDVPTSMRFDGVKIVSAKAT
jgi:hypothetical protein